MDQSGALADTLSKTSSLLGGLLQQMDGSASSDVSEGLFSDILTQNQSFDSSFAPTSPQPSVASSSGTDPSSVLSLSSSNIIQNLNNLSSTLHQTLAALQAQNNPSNSNTQLSRQKSTTTENSDIQSADNSTQAQTTSSASNSQQIPGTSSTSGFGAATSVSVFTKPTANTNSTTDLPSDASTTTVSSSSTKDAQTLSDIIAELLALTQLMIKNLEANKIALNGNTAASAAQAVGGTTAAQGAAGSANASTDPSSPADPLLQLIAALEKTTQALPPNSADASQTSTASPLSSENMATLEANVSTLAADLLAAFGKDVGLRTLSTTQSVATTSSSPSTNVTTELEALDAGLKNVLASLQMQKITASSSPTKTVLTSTVADTPTVSAVPTSLLTPTLTNSAPKSLAATETEKASTGQATWQAENAASSLVSSKQTSDASPLQISAASAALISSSDKNGAGADFNEDANNFSGGNAAPGLQSLSSGITAGGAQASGTYSFASTLSALRATNGGSTGLPSVVDQVILQMNRNVKSGNDQMSVQLTPGDLGKITVKLDITNEGKVQGTVTADNPQTLGMLQKDSRSLERALQDAGLRADPGSLQFNLGGQGGQNAGNTGTNAGSKNGNGNTDGTISAEDTSGLVEIGALSETYYVTPNGVNIQV